MTQETASEGFGSERFSFSLGIIVTLLVGAFSLSDYLRTNTTYLAATTYLQYQSEHPDTQKEKHLQELEKNTANLQLVLVRVVYIGIIPTLIVTMMLISFCFFLQIVCRAMWFSASDSGGESFSPEAAIRLDKLANAFYSLSLNLLVLVFATILCLMAWFAGCGLLLLASGYEKKVFFLVYLITPGWLAFSLIRFTRHTYQERHTRSRARTLLRLGPLLGLVTVCVLSLFNNSFVGFVAFGAIVSLFSLVFVLPALFFKSLHPIIRFVGQKTGGFSWFHSLRAYSNESRLGKIFYRVGIKTALVIILFLFMWGEWLIWNASHTLKIEMDKHIYTPGETSMITVTRGGLLEGAVCLKYGVIDQEKKTTKNCDPPGKGEGKGEFNGPYKEDIGRLKYFIDLPQLGGQEDRKGGAVEEVLVSHKRFTGSPVESKAYFKVLGTPGVGGG